MFFFKLYVQVKRIFTARTITGLIVGMVLYHIATGLPQSLGIGLTVTTSPLTNRTLIIFDLKKHKHRMAITSLTVSHSFPTTACFIIVLVATIFLIVSFNESRLFFSCALSYLFQCTSCSANIFVYLCLSSRFKQIFKEIFLCFMES